MNKTDPKVSPTLSPAEQGVIIMCDGYGNPDPNGKFVRVVHPDVIKPVVFAADPATVAAQEAGAKVFKDLVHDLPAREWHTGVARLRDADKSPVGQALAQNLEILATSDDAISEAEAHMSELPNAARGVDFVTPLNRGGNGAHGDRIELHTSKAREVVGGEALWAGIDYRFSAPPPVLRELQEALRLTKEANATADAYRLALMENTSSGTFWTSPRGLEFRASYDSMGRAVYAAAVVQHGDHWAIRTWLLCGRALDGTPQEAFSVLENVTPNEFLQWCDWHGLRPPQAASILEALVKWESEQLGEQISFAPDALT